MRSADHATTTLAHVAIRSMVYLALGGREEWTWDGKRQRLTWHTRKVARSNADMPTALYELADETSLSRSVRVRIPIGKSHKHPSM